ncbi:hypothetical protein SEPCBS57363_002345 [Sporothrix epigloea]|uniref:BZIP domain-containing protein n=1 Tax=Sporothrix epigloea TaxID=1892477 RepID=A0ABP0DH07_9PEZI
MVSLMDSSLSAASTPVMGLESSGRSDAQLGASQGVSKTSQRETSQRAAGARKPAKVSKTKAPDGTNSDHRKEQNRIASRNYREKRKHKLALLKQILDDPSTGEDNAGTVTNATTQPPLPASSARADVDDVLSDRNVMGPLSGLPMTSMAPSLSPASTSTATTSLSATAPEEQQLEDSFAAWAAANLPSAMPDNSLRNHSIAASSTSSAVDDFFFDMPMLQPWLISASDCQTSPFSSQLQPITYPPFDPIATETIGFDATFEPAVDVDRVTDRTSNLADFATSYYTNSLQAVHIQERGIPLQQIAQSNPVIPTVPASPRNGRLQQTWPMTTTLPSRPSPRPHFQTLAGPINATSGIEQEPQKETPNKNKPAVRSMIRYVQTLSPHQKRLILQALLDDDGGVGGGDDIDRRFSDNGDDRIEEIDNTRDSNDTNDNSTKRQEALICRREDRRRQIVARWNSHRWAGEAAEIGAAHHVRSSASSTYSSASSLSDAAEAASYAKFAISGLGGPMPQARSLSGPRSYYSTSLNILTLQCRRMGFRAALLQNCLACGLSEPDAMFDESCYEECEQVQSPFALREVEARAVVLQGAGQIAAAVAAVRQNLARSGKMPPRDLQPVDAQILVAHHPYLDVIPFGGFRGRALALLAEMEADKEVAAAVSENLKRNGTSIELPYLLDEDELCYDMNVADGLVCWGSQVGNAGASQSAQAKRDSDSARDMRSCQPWDMRSWEPQVWFLKKYWYLVGGWDDDMWRNCRWWHSMRGDDLDYSVFALPGY